MQLSTLLSIKTGGCPEDCGYCPQAARYHTGVANEALLSVEEVVGGRARAKANGATRFCMGAAWRGPKQRDLEPRARDGEGGEGARPGDLRTLGMLKDGQAEQLKAAGLDYYNHNLDTAPEFYGEIITHAHPGRPPRHARARARGRHARLLRRHRRHGRDRARTRAA